MKIKFEENLEYQIDAISAITDIFSGQEIAKTVFTVEKSNNPQLSIVADENDLGTGNKLLLLPEEISENLNNIQTRNGLAKTEVLGKNRKTYCSSMLKLVEREFYENNLYLKLNPNIERIKIIKIWKKTLLGLISFILALTFSLPAFANVTDLSQDRVEVLGQELNNFEINNRGRVEIISDEEYQKLELGMLSSRQSDTAKVNEKIKLGRFENTSYDFKFIDDKNEGFIINLENMSCSGGVEFSVIIEEDGEIIYKRRFAADSTLKVKTQKGSAYIITVCNESNKDLSGEISIKSYLK